MSNRIYENEEPILSTLPAPEHFLSEIEMQFASNRKVLEPAVYQELEGFARDMRNPHRTRAMQLMLQAA